MLGKLLKYEFQATGRWFLPAYGLLIVMAVISRITLAIRDASSYNYNRLEWTERVGDLAVMLVTMAYVFIIAAVFIATTIIIVQRFYKNLMGDEGYLMFTLPVRPWENISAKLISALVWIAASTVMVLLSLFIIAANQEFLYYFGEGMREVLTVFRDLGMQGPLFLWLTIANIVAGAFYFVLHIYAAIAIGQLSNNYKVLCSFGAYIGISIVMNIISGICSMFMMMAPGGVFSELMGYGSYYYSSVNDSISAFTNTLNFAQGIGLLLNVVFIVGMFWVTNYLLEKKLNLE